MRQGHYEAAEHYILYRAQRSRLREAEALAEDPNQEFMVTVTTDDGQSSFWDGSELKKRIAYASIGLDLLLPARCRNRARTPPLSRHPNLRERPQKHHHPQRKIADRKRR